MLCTEHTVLACWAMPRPLRYVVSPLPGWSKRIRKIRSTLKLSQAALALRLRCSAMTVSRWERGLLRPTSAKLIALGRLAGPPSGRHFWQMAGISPHAIKQMFDRKKVKGRRRRRK
jgi:transcriptional regulator with XRE-family HTH domain